MAEMAGTGERNGLVRRHPLVVRLTHWINVVAVVMLLGTGLNIFNAHPMLYWGARGSSVDTGGRWLAIGTVPDGSGGWRGMVVLGGLRLETTGVLGVSRSKAGKENRIAFPHWATIPGVRDLATARNWHFLAGWVLILNGLLYLIWGLGSGHIRRRLLPERAELAPGHVLADLGDHLRLRFPKGEKALRYQVLQKLAYSGTALVLLPLMVVSGLGMAPGMDASWPWIVDLFGGRQSARSVHFILTVLVVGFVLVHLLMLLLAGPWRLLRGMVTGWQRIELAAGPEGAR
jgi:thiosulfate reductase cytochrome b subunit